MLGRVSIFLCVFALIPSLLAQNHTTKKSERAVNPKKIDEKALTKELSELPPFAKLSEKARKALMSQAQRILNPHLGKTFSECFGASVSFGLGVNVLRNPVITIKKRHLDRFITGIPHSNENEMELPFRPLKVGKDSLILELPLSVRERKLDKDRRQFMVVKLFESDKRTSFEITSVTLQAERIAVEDPVLYEASEFLKCREQWHGEDPLKKRATAFKFEKIPGIEIFSTRMAEEKTSAQAKAARQLAEYLSKYQHSFPERVLDLQKSAKKVEQVNKKLEQRVTDLKKTVAELKKVEVEAERKYKIANQTVENTISQARATVREAQKREKERDTLEKERDDFIRQYLQRHFEMFGTRVTVDQFKRGILPKGGKMSPAYDEKWKKVFVKNGAVAANQMVRKDFEQINQLNKSILSWTKWISEKNEKMEELSHRSVELGKQLKKHNDAADVVGEKLVEAARATKTAQIELKGLEDFLPEQQKVFEEYRKTIKDLGKSLFERTDAHSGQVLMLGPLPKQALAIAKAGDKQGKAQFFSLAVRDKKDFSVKQSAIVSIGPDSKGKMQIKLVSIDESIDPEKFFNQEFHTWEKLPKGGVIASRKTINPKRTLEQLNQMYTSLEASSKKKVPFTKLKSHDGLLKFLKDNRLMDPKSKEIDMNFIYMPGQARRLPQGMIAAVIPPKGVQSLFGISMDEGLARKAIENEYGKHWMASVYDPELLDKRSADILAHEFAHELDRTLWKWTPVEKLEAQKKKTLEAFPKAFPKLAQWERRSRSYQKQFEQWKEQRNEDALDLTTLTPKQIEQAAKGAFEKSVYGKDFELVREPYRERYSYLSMPTEQVAFAVQVAYLRDVEKLSFDEVINRTKRQGGGNPSSEMLEFERQFFRRLYENRDLNGLIGAVQSGTNLIPDP